MKTNWCVKPCGADAIAVKSNQPCAFECLRAGLFVCVTALLLASGCTPSPKNAGPKYVFFPPPPDAPRLQFLTAFSSERDLRGGGGGFFTFVTGTQPAEKPVGKPYGASFSEKKMYICDTAYGEVLKVDLEARRFSSMDTRGPGAVKLPLNIAIDSDGTTYVADSGRDQVVIFDTNENFVAAIGTKGATRPRDVALAPDRFYVGDIQNHCIHAYDKASRKLLVDIPRPEDQTNVARRLFQPANLAVDRQGHVYASDVGAFHIQVYDADGKYARTVGEYGDNAGEFSRPKGIAVDRDGRLYAVDAAAQVVQLFDEHGRLLMWFGDPRASRVGFDLPAKVVVDYDHVGLFARYAAPDFKVDYLVIVINQFGPRKVSVFGFGHKA
jgi:sugar lactone lactonase YvrE